MIDFKDFSGAGVGTAQWRSILKNNETNNYILLNRIQSNKQSLRIHKQVGI